MGFGGISIWQLLIILGIIVLVFGTKKLRSLGGDLGGAIKSFKQAINEGDENTSTDKAVTDSDNDRTDNPTAKQKNN